MKTDEEKIEDVLDILDGIEPIDRSGWDSGPWDNEPDRKIWKDQETKLLCQARRSRLGYLCGYVGVDKEHPLFGKDWHHGVNLNAHGGINFSDFIGESNLWWFGFDCGHTYDCSPYDSIFNFVIETFKSTKSKSTKSYKTLEYVMNECTKLAKQLSERKQK